ncbi:heterokaryon incompatibility protein [Colletotrichum melonis]|uniref:Heterokaryon incompatibility protein n=1 Tax=Colletotrichum melonis TaxID=1209925 RepID=A0AAI9XYU4_9PEZI|nr:heterokaryon incompatibility protein [Colletotrichum melonis]
MVQESNQSSAEYGPMKRTIQFDDSPPPKHRQIHRPTFTHSNETVLCTACKDDFSKESVKADDFRRRRRNQHHESSEDLAKAVEKGCYFCKRFARHSADPSISTVLNEDLILHPRPNPVRLFFAGSEQHTGRAWREDDLDDLWLNDCVRNHPECKVFYSHSTWLPSRLIDVGDPGSHWWKVITTDHHQTPANYGGYLTLSHRWGSSPFVQLTSDTLPAFQKNTAIKSLPKTFHDTIALAHHFNIHWKEESSRMDHVYSNSTCNIVAAHSEGPDGGLFTARDPSVLESLVVCSERTDIPSREYTVWDHTSILNDYNRAPLYKRSWVFQERLLPKRTLHFGKDQVFWKCRRRRACESLPDGIPVAPDNDVVEREKGVTRIRKMRPQEEEDSPEDEEMFATVGHVQRRGFAES